MDTWYTDNQTRKRMKEALYLSVSTTEQEAASQLLALEDYAKRRGFEIVQVYSENETAWKGGHQAELARLYEDARKGRFEVVLVWALDRLSREDALAILSFVDKFKRYGAKVISYQESWTEAPWDLADVLYAITGWVARMESQRRSERTKSGLERARAEGKPIGNRGRDRKKRKPRTSQKVAPKIGGGF
jgi:DNA invertase Pin-like site-specific DNA recombinase